eukprot:gene3175-5491_t
MDYRHGGIVPKKRKESQIFEYNFDSNPRLWSPPGRPDLKFKVPKDVTLTPIGSTQQRINTAVTKSYKEYTSSITYSFGSAIDNLEKFGLGGEYNPKYKKIFQKFEDNFSLISAYFAGQAYKVISRPPFLRKLHPDFIKMVELIPSNPTKPDIKKYEVALKNFGGFHQVDSTFGGEVFKHTFLNKNLTNNRNSRYIVEQSRNTYLCLKGECAHANGSRITIDEYFRNNSVTELFYNGGLKEHHNTQNITNEWQYSIDDSPDILLSNLRLISDLIKGDPMKKSNFEKVIKTYSLTGKVEIPKSSEIVNGKSKILGHHIIGAGYDPIEMQVRENVLDMDTNEFNGVWKNKFLVLNNIKVVDKSNIETKSVNLFQNKNDYIKQFIVKKIKKVLTAAGKRSSDIYEFLKQQSNANSKIEVEKKTSEYELRLSPEIYISKKIGSKYISSSFKKLVSNLGTNYDDNKVYQQYKEIIQKFGSQFVIGTEIGNSIRSDFYFKNTMLKENSAEMIKNEASAFFDSVVEKKQVSVNDWFTKNVNSKVVITGKKQDPEALSFDVLPISVLIECPVKARLMNLAIEEFNQQFAETDPLNENKVFTQDEIEEKFTLKI